MSDPQPDKPVTPTPLDHTPAGTDPEPDKRVTPTALDHTPAETATAPSVAAILVAEFFGTFLLVLGVISTAIFAANFPSTDNGTSLGVGFVGVSLAVGLTVVAGAYAFGPISGGHFNPAVTLGLAAAGRFPWKDTGGYIVAQIVGGAVATSLIALVLAFGPENAFGNVREAGFASNGFGNLSPGGFGIGAAIVVEVLFTALFVIVILGVTHDRRGNPALAGLVIGLTLTLIHLCTIPVDNTSVNPARSIATAIYGGGDALAQLWVFIVFPIVGGLIAGFAYKALFDGTKGRAATRR